MNSLVKELIQPLLEETTKTVAIFPGKFKPPHKGHFEVAKNLLDKADEIIIAISPVVVDGITPQQSKAVWELYNQLLGNKLKIEIVDKSPVKYTLDTIKENPNINFIPVFGKGEEDRYKSLVGKSNVEVYDGGTVEELNARDFRKILSTGQNFDKFLPVGINKDEFLSVFLSDIQEDMSQSDLASVEAYADKELAPIDVDFTKHFFDRLNDPRNIKPISPAELIGFFKRLARKKDKLEDFLNQYREIVASDNRTNINIPLVSMSDKIIAKTIMRKKDFQSPDPKIELNELEDYEVKYWAIHADIYDALKKDPNKIYNFLKTKLTGERLKALEYFYNEYFMKPEKLMENCGCMHTQQPMDFRSALASLTKHMMDQGYNISPLPKLKIISNDIQNAENILGKTAYYDPNNCSITLYTLNRHPKDVLRSYSHEMIHRIQDNEGRLNNVNTTNTNEDSNLQELEKEAYLNGNIIFRNWEDSIKNV
jgi:hypothetical protein